LGAVRLLVLSSGFPYPVDAGRKAVLAGFLDYAVATLGAENVVLLCVSSMRSEEEAAALAPCRVVFFRPAAAVVRAALAALNGLLLRRRAIQEMVVAAPAIAPSVAAFLAGFDPDIIFVDTIRMVQHLPPAARRLRRCVLYLDDLYSLRYRRTIAALEAYPDAAFNPVGTFDRFLPAALGRLTRSRALQRLLLALESGILARREAAMPCEFDRVLLLNAEEAARLASATGMKNVAAIMPLLPRPREAAGPAARRFTGNPTFLFLGYLRYPANAHGLSLFLRRALPIFLTRVPTGRLVVAGAGASRELRALADSFGRQVSLAEYVEDLGPLFRSAAGMVVPLVFGTGVKIKVVEALALGLPLVSTRCGIDGLGLEPGVHCFVDDDIAHFPDIMLRLLDPATNAKISRAGAAYYARRLAPEAVVDAYRQLLFEDLPARRPAVQRLDRGGVRSPPPAPQAPSEPAMSPAEGGAR
jgi:glycosyltransferase involved in cell wall biosynthesis